MFQEDWDKLPEPALDVDKGKQLVEEAGAAGKTIVIGTSNEIQSLQTAANAIRQAAISIGLKAKLKSVSAANYINFFTDPEARKGVDGFITVNYPDFADPAAFYNTFAIKGGSQNYSGFEDAGITKALEEARTTSDQRKRAELTAEAGDLIMEHAAVAPARGAEHDRRHGQGDHRRARPRSSTWADPGRRRSAAAAEPMLRFVARRLAMLVATLLVASFAIYAALTIAPGDPLVGRSRAGGRCRPRPSPCCARATTSTRPCRPSTGTG